MFRRVEVVIGLLTVALCVFGVGLAIFGPATYITNEFAAGSTSLWDVGLNGEAVVYLSFMLLAGLAVLAGAWLRSEAADAMGTAVLWIGTLALLVGMAIGIPGNTTGVVPTTLHTDTPDSVGIGIYFVPAVLMAFTTGIVSMAIHHTPRKPIAMRPH